MLPYRPMIPLVSIVAVPTEPWYMNTTFNLYLTGLLAVLAVARILYCIRKLRNHA